MSTNRLHPKNQMNSAFEEAPHDCSICAGFGKKRKDGPCRGHMKGGAGKGGSTGNAYKAFEENSSKTFFSSTAYIFSVLASFIKATAGYQQTRTVVPRSAVDFGYNLQLLNKLKSANHRVYTPGAKAQPNHFKPSPNKANPAAASEKAQANHFKSKKANPAAASKKLTEPMQIVRPSPRF